MHSAGAGAEESAWTLGELEVRTLRLVVAGVPDKAVANCLGVSHRTVQRRIRDLMERTDARNRMQLGRRAAQAGIQARRTAPTRPGNPTPDNPTADRPDEDSVRLLWLLLTDASWTAASDALGMSRRSAERRLQDLMTMAGATSRAQLGWYATRHEWI